MGILISFFVHGTRVIYNLVLICARVAQTVLQRRDEVSTGWYCCPFRRVVQLRDGGLYKVCGSFSWDRGCYTRGMFGSLASGTSIEFCLE